jgi:hypothetical protein
MMYPDWSTVILEAKVVGIPDSSIGVLTTMVTTSGDNTELIEVDSVEGFRKGIRWTS